MSVVTVRLLNKTTQTTHQFFLTCSVNTEIEEYLIFGWCPYSLADTSLSDGDVLQRSQPEKKGIICTSY